MGDKTGIQWTDATWNPTTGCRKVSAGCANCYAERVFPRAYAGQQTHEVSKSASGVGTVTVVRQRRFTDVRTHPERLDQPLRWERPRRVFVDSMSDLFHEDVPDDFIEAVWRVMAECQRHTFQILTKRPERMRDWCERQHSRASDAAAAGFPAENAAPWPPLPNVWLGVSVEDQAAADARVPVLLDTPAAVRFLSCEPLIGPVDATPWLPPPVTDAMRYGDWPRGMARTPCVNWLIVGGESGPKARPMDLAWARSLVEQGRSAGVPVFVKQLGRRPIVASGFMDGDRPITAPLDLRDSHGGDPDEWPDDLRVRQFPGAAA